MEKFYLNGETIFRKWPYKGVEAVWLRWFTPKGDMLPTEAEAAEQKAEAAEQRAEATREELAATRQALATAQQLTETLEQRVERMAERLRQLGMDPNAM